MGIHDLPMHASILPWAFMALPLARHIAPWAVSWQSHGNIMKLSLQCNDGPSKPLAKSHGHPIEAHGSHGTTVP